MDSQSNSITIYIFIYQKLGKPTVLSPPPKNKTFHCGACPRPGLGWKSPRGVLCEGLGQGRQWMHQRGIRGCLNEPVFLFSSEDEPMKIQRINQTSQDLSSNIMQKRWVYGTTLRALANINGLSNTCHTKMAAGRPGKIGAFWPPRTKDVHQCYCGWDDH